MKQICCKIRIIEARSVIPVACCIVGVILLFNLYFIIQKIIFPINKRGKFNIHRNSKIFVGPFMVKHGQYLLEKILIAEQKL